MFLLILLHAGDEGFDILQGACVVEGSAETAYGAVALDAHHAAFLGKLHEVVLEFFVARSHHPTMVHDGAVLLIRHGAYEETVAVNLVIEKVGLLHVEFVHGFQAADGVLDPTERLVHHEDGQYGGRVEHRDVASLFGCMRAVVDHRGQRVHVGAVANLAEKVLADNYERHAGGTYVLLSTAIDDTILRHVDGTAHDVGRHVGHKRHAVHLFGREIFANLRTIDCIVGRDVEIVGIGRHFPSRRDIAVGLIFRTCHDDRFAEVLGLLGSLLGPNARLEIGRLFLHQVCGQHEELCAGTTTEEENLVGVGDAKQVAPQLTCLSHKTLPAGGAVRNLHKTNTRVVEIADGIDGRLYGFFGKYAGSCIEIVLFHWLCWYDFDLKRCVFFGGKGMEKNF